MRHPLLPRAQSNPETCWRTPCHHPIEQMYITHHSTNAVITLDAQLTDYLFYDIAALYSLRRCAFAPAGGGNHTYIFYS